MASIAYIEDLDRETRDLLTRLLYLPPTFSIDPSWLAGQAHLLSTYPPTLHRPKGFLPRLVAHLPLSASSPGRAILCPTHKPLNPFLIRRVFLQVSAEASSRLDRLSASCLPIPMAVAATLRRLQRLNSLWLAPEIYRTIFAAPPSEARFQRQADGCEACILARIGGNVDVLLDLRSAILSRKRKTAPPPRLLALVEEWIAWTGEGDRIMDESERVGREMRHFRRHLQAAAKGRKPRRHHSRRGTPGEKSERPAQVAEPVHAVEEADDGSRYDTEIDIINFYQKGISTMHLPLEEAIGMVHEAFRDSLIFTSETGTFHRPAAPTPPSTAYAESIYASDSGFAGSADQPGSSCPSRAGKRSEQWAQSYQQLVGIPEQQGWDVVGEAVKDPDELTNHRWTRWSDMYRVDG